MTIAVDDRFAHPASYDHRNLDRTSGGGAFDPLDAVRGFTVDAHGSPEARDLADTIRLVEEHGGSAPSIIALAWALAGSGRLDDAVDLLDRLRLGLDDVATCDDDPAFHAGWILAEHGRVDRAVERYERCAANANLASSAPVWTHLGFAHHAHGAYDDAAACYRRAIESGAAPLVEALLRRAVERTAPPADVRRDEQGVTADAPTD